MLQNMVQKRNCSKIVITTYTCNIHSCEIFVVSKTSNVISSYVLKCANIVEDVVDLDSMKMVEEIK